MPRSGTDRWATWLLHRRDGDDPEQRAIAIDWLLPIRDRVLERASIQPGDVVLDVGAGDGLIAFGAAERVGPSGTVIFSEPINSYFPESFDDFWGFDARPVRDLVRKIWEHEGWIGDRAETAPMLNFTEKDLLRLAESAGFGEIDLELRVQVRQGTWVADWQRLLDTSPNPNAHTAREAIEGALTEEEAARLEAQIRPLADSGRGVIRDASAYLSALKR